MATTPPCDDLLIDILSRLPMADLYRCKAVSKDWQRRLVPSALSLRPVKLSILHHVGNCEPCMISISDLSPLISFHNASTDRMFFHLLGVCNGMALFRKEHRTDTSSPSPLNEIVHYVVYNPVSGRLSPIHLPPEQHLYYGFHFVVFDRRLSAQHFMILYWRMRRKDKRPRAYLYSSKANDWRDLGLWSEQLSGKRIDEDVTDSCCLNGIAYKIAGNCDGESIIAVEVEKERVFLIASPSVSCPDHDRRRRVFEEADCRRILGEFNGRLCFGYYNCRSFKTWVMRAGCVGAGESDQWILIHNVDLRLAVDKLTLDWRMNIVSFAFHPDHADILLLNLNGFLFIFNLKTEVISRVKIPKPVRKQMAIHDNKIDSCSSKKNDAYNFSYSRLLYPFI